MLKICIGQLKPSSPRLHGATVGEEHSRQVCQKIGGCSKAEYTVVLDFTGVEGASGSYLKRLINPFFLSTDDAESLPPGLSPVLINIEASDLREELNDFLSGKGWAMVVAHSDTTRLRFQGLIGRLDGAAAETFRELLTMKRATAAELYERHREETTNQTAWNNRLVQLVDMRIARRTRIGRFWVYEPIAQK